MSNSDGLLMSARTHRDALLLTNAHLRRGAVVQRALQIHPLQQRRRAPPRAGGSATECAASRILSSAER